MIRRLGLGLLLVLLAGTLLGGAWLFGTSAGTRLVIAYASGLLPDVKLRHESGTLFGPLRMRLVDVGLRNMRVRIEDMTVDWAPACLLIGDLCLRDVQAERLEITLVPPATPPAGARRLPQLRLPLDIDAGNLAVRHLDIVRGQQVTRFIDVAAALAWEDGHMRVDRLALAMPQWEAHASGTLDSHGDWPLDARVLLRIPRDGDLLFSLQGKAFGSLVDTRLDLTSDGVIAARLLGQIATLTPGLPFRLDADAARLRLPPSAEPARATHVDDIRLQADGKLAERFRITGTAALDTPWTPPLPATASVDATVRGVERGELRIAHPRLDARLGTRWDWIGGQRFRFDADIRHLDLALFNPALSSRLAGRARLDGSLVAGDNDVRIAVDNLAGTLGLRALAAAGDLRWHNSVLEFRDFRVDQGANRARLTGFLGETWSTDATLELGNLSTLQPAFAGQATGSARIGGAPANPQIDFTLDARALRLPAVTLPAPVARTLQVPLADWTVQGTATLRSVHIADATTRAPDFAITASGDVGWQRGLRWDIATRLTDFPLARLAPELAGRLSGPFATRGELDDTLAALDVDTQLAGTMDGQPLAVHAQAQYRPGDIRVPVLMLQHAGNRLEGHAGWRDDVLDLAVDAAAPALADSFRTLSGAANVRARINGTPATADGTLTLDATALRQGGLRIDTLGGALELHDGGHVASQASLTITGLRRDNDDVALDAALTVHGNRDRHRIDIDARHGPLQLSLGAAGTLPAAARENTERPADWQGTLDYGLLKWRDWAWRAANPPALAVHGNSVRLDAHCWTDGAGRACLTAPAVLGATGQLQGEAFHLSPGLLVADLLPLDTGIDGQVGGTFAAHWTAGVLDMLQADLRNATPLVLTERAEDGTPRTIATLDTVQAGSDVSTTRAEVAARLAGRDTGTVDAIVALDRSTQTLDGEIQVQRLNLGIVDAFVYQVHEIGGTVDARLDVDGTADAPRLTGQAALRDGRASLVRTPLSIEGARLDGRFDGEEMQLTGAFRTPDSREDVAVDGNFVLRGHGWYGEASARGNALVIALPPQYHFTTAPDLRLRLDDRRVLLTGNVRVPEGRIELKTLPTQSVERSRDVVVVREEEVFMARAPLFERHVDVGLALGNDIRFRAFGAQGNLAGNLRVRTRPDLPLLVDGELHVQDGRYTAFGQTLNLRQADIIFNGPADQPLVDAVAFRELNDASMKEVGVRLSGSLRKPETTLWSTPEVPQEEALTWLLTGRGPSSDPVNYRGEAAQAALSLGIAQGSALLNQAGQQLGLKEFQLSTGGDGEETEVQVGTAINDRVYVGYNRRVFSGEDSLLLRLHMTRRLMLEALSGLESALDIFYTFEF